MKKPVFILLIFLTFFLVGCTKQPEIKLSGLNEVELKNLPIKLAVVEFEAKDQFDYGKVYYCCIGKDCFFTFYDIECENKKEYSYLDVLNNADGVLPGKVTASGYIFPSGGGANLNPDGDHVPHSLFYINDYIKQEAEEYGKGYDRDIFNITIFGPYKLISDPPKHGPNDPYGPIINFFDDEIANREINLDEYDMVVFIFLNDFNQNQGYPGFRSFASSRSLYISTESIDAYSDEKLGVFMHENLHTLGRFIGTASVSDKYIEPCPRGSYMSCCKVPEGIAEPDKWPLYPQKNACIMCESIPLAKDGEGRRWNTLKEVVICSETAKELGWIGGYEAKEKECYDSDGWQIDIKGLVQSGSEVKEDYCVNDTILREFHCADEKIGEEDFDCSQRGFTSCFRGRCE